MSKLSGKIAVVTGGTGALGRIVVATLLDQGAKVIATHTGNEASQKYLFDIRKEHSELDDAIVDVTSEESVNEFYKTIDARYRRIDILCNLVGGVTAKRNIEEVVPDEWNKMMKLNLFSCFLMTKNAIQRMKGSGFGRIVNIASMPGVTPEAQRGAYGISKAGVIALTKTVAAEIKEAGDLTVNAIAPSIILTEENKSWGTEEDQKKWVRPEEIAEMIVHLCGKTGASINGQIIQMYGKV